MNDYVIRFTPRTDDGIFSHERLVEAVQEMMDNGSEWTGPSGWKVLQHGEFDVMASALVREKQWAGELLTKTLKEAMTNQFSSENYIPSTKEEIEQREKLKDVYCSPEAIEDLRNWNMEYSDDGKLSWWKEELKDKVKEHEPTYMVD